MPPYWPWVQAIRSYVRERDPEQLRSEMGSGAADIAEVVSDVRDRLPDLQPPPQLESPEQARFRLFDSISSFLKTASQKQPLVLVLDDLHWADHPSLLLLEFVARELGGGRLLVMGTYRDVEVSRRHPLSQTLGELTRERLFQRVLLRGLNQEDVGRFIELVSGFSPPPGLVESVHSQTEGNPLFVTEVVRLLVQEEALTPEGARERDSWSVRIPEGVREVIGRRLDRLTDRCNQTLTVAAVVGREFSLEQLKPLVEDLTEDRLLEVMEEALQARVIEELPRAAGQYQFTHALIQETLAEELSLTRRVRLHAQIAEALESLYGADAEAHAAELAHHFAEAEAVLDTERLVKYSLVAGERALGAYAWEEALTYFQRGLATQIGQPVDNEIAALLFGQGRAQVATLPAELLNDAVSNLSQAFAYYAEIKDMERTAAVAESLHRIPSGSLRLTGAHQMITQALTLLPPDSHAAGYLWSTSGRVAGLLERNYVGAQQAFQHALTIAQREHDTVMQMRVSADSARVEQMYLHLDKGLEESERSVAMAQAASEYELEMDARYVAGSILVDLGNLEAGRRHAEVILTLSERLHALRWMSASNALNGITHSIAGDWHNGLHFSEQGLSASPRDHNLLVHRVLLEFEQGNVQRGSGYLERLKEVLHSPAATSRTQYAMATLAMAMVARITGSSRDYDRIEWAAQSAISSGFATPVTSTLANAGLGLLAVVAEDAKMAGTQYSTLEPIASSMIWSMISIDRVWGLLAHTMGDLEKAVDHFLDSLNFCRQAGYRPELAWTCCDYADTLLQRNNPGDREQAMS
ncbi:MAG: AAA family ATPase, partial [Dehalococcoidia bacterium]